MMLQEIAPHIYDNSFLNAPPEAEDYAIIWQSGKALLRQGTEEICLPTIGELSGQSWQPLFRLDGRGVYLCTSEPETLPVGFDFTATRSLTDAQPQHLAFALAAAGSLARWYGVNRYCGRCAQPMQPSRTERAQVCPECGNTVYPKICPAVIVAIVRDGKLLLTRYAGRPFKRWALVAGFNEIGESIEDTVRREVMEETGLTVTELSFYRSQPWVISDSLLMGFYCRAEAGEITLQEDELAEAVWFAQEELPENHTRTSLTGEMIERFRQLGETVFGMNAQ